MLLNSLTYLVKGDDSVMSIHPKSLEYQYMVFNGVQGKVLSVCVIAVVPLVYLLVGIVIYRKRRKK